MNNIEMFVEKVKHQLNERVSHSDNVKLARVKTTITHIEVIELLNTDLIKGNGRKGYNKFPYRGSFLIDLEFTVLCDFKAVYDECLDRAKVKLPLYHYHDKEMLYRFFQDMAKNGSTLGTNKITFIPGDNYARDIKLKYLSNKEK